MRTHRPHRAGGDRIRLIESGQQRQSHTALVVQVNTAPVLNSLVRVHRPQAIAFVLGEDQVVHFRLDRNPHRPATHLQIQIARR